MSALRASEMKASYPATLIWKNFTELSEELSTKVLTWRNHPDVRRWMRYSEEITLEAHLQFLLELRKTSQKQYFLLSFGGAEIGVVDFYNINHSERTCYYGYYLNPEFLGASYGLLLEYWVAEFAFSKLKMLSIRAETKPDNKAANELHEYFGFVPDNGLNADQLQEAVLSQNDWVQKRQEIQPVIFRMFGA